MKVSISQSAYPLPTGSVGVHGKDGTKICGRQGNCGTPSRHAQRLSKGRVHRRRAPGTGAGDSRPSVPEQDGSSIQRDEERRGKALQEHKPDDRGPGKPLSNLTVGTRIHPDVQERLQEPRRSRPAKSQRGNQGYCRLGRPCTPGDAQVWQVEGSTRVRCQTRYQGALFG